MSNKTQGSANFQPTTPYKGTRDFLPADFANQAYIFNTWRVVLAQNGFEEYQTSLLENANLYIAKSGQELGSSQLYSFEDKGGRHLALRPEQTPSTARLVAGHQRNLKLPLKWFSIPNCFRYEQPQKGRFREHWQLNVDIIGTKAGHSELEILMLLGQIFLAFGAQTSMFKIDYNHRQLLDLWLEKNEMLAKKEVIYKLLDSWYKMDEGQKIGYCKDQNLSDNETQKIFELASRTGQSWADYQELAGGFAELKDLQNQLDTLGQGVNYSLNPCIIRGIAYYTGIVFEAFDQNPENSRSLFGGGRYDNLMELFGDKTASQPAIGFGFGDATMTEFLLGHNLLPENLQSDSQRKVDTGILVLSPESFNMVYLQIIPDLKKAGKIWLLDYDFDRSENKRFESLKKRGCVDIIKV